jgi:hypothetical protein
MKERVKVYTHATGEGSTLGDSDLENSLNKWLASVDGRISMVTQSESHRPGKAQHLTICIWYIPEDA